MKDRVLFSCIGNTDPMNTRNLRDGPMLHIVRHYKPKYIYLYLSKEMIDYHRKENRYDPYLDFMKDYLGIDYEVVYIERPELENPHIFDSFFEDMRGELNKIREIHPHCEILGNISSGTPAMKSAIQILSAFLDFELKTIQVSTPEKGTHDTPEKVDKEYWEINLDNEDIRNRCIEGKNINLNREMKVGLIKKFIDIYDYLAAYEIALSIKDFLDPRVIEYLSFQKHRYDLNIQSGRDNLKILKPGNIFDKGRENISYVYEYFLRWQAQSSNKEYLVFIVGISPLLANLQKLALEKYSLGRVTLDKNGRYKQCRFDEQTKSILKNNDINIDGEGVYNSHTINKLIQQVDYIPENIKKNFNNLRKVEGKVRNKAAHQIKCITHDIVKKDTGFSIPEISNMAWDLICNIDEDITGIYRGAYDAINDNIKELLK